MGEAEMILNKETQIAIFTPFKCYSTSIQAHCESLPGWEYRTGLQPYDGLIGPHTNVRVEGMRHYVLTRNPYDRVLSQWKYDCMVNGEKPFEQWFGRRFERHYGPVTLLYPFDEIIRVEELVDGLNQIGMPTANFPHENRGEQHHELTQWERDEIFEIHRWDFEVGGYQY